MPTSPALALAALIVAAEPQTDAELTEHVNQAFEAWLTVKDPWAQLEQGKVTAVTVLIDGQELGACKENARDRTDVCFADARVAPGEHILELRLVAKNKTTLFPMQFSGSERLTVKPHERLVFNLQASLAEGAKQEAYVVRTAGSAHTTPCLTALEELASAPSCTLADVQQLRPKVDRARSQCSAGVLDSHWARVLVRQAFAHTFEPNISACHTPEDRKKLSSRLADRWGSERLWPKDTVTVSSWNWARQLPASAEPDSLNAAALLELQSRSLATVIERLPIVETLVAAELDPKSTPELLRNVQQRPFSFDPRTPNGHLWFSAVALAERRDAAVPAFAAALAGHVEKDATLDCAKDREQELLVRYFLEDDHVSTADWKAVTAMMQRTPEDEGLGRCDHLVDPRTQSDLGAAERLRWLGKFDCSDKRHPRLRGNAFKSILQLNAGDKTAEVEKVAAEFKGCGSP